MARRRRRRANIIPTLDQHLLFDGYGYGYMKLIRQWQGGLNTLTYMFGSCSIIYILHHPHS